MGAFAFFRIADGVAGHTQVLALFDRSSNTSGDNSINGSYEAPKASHTSLDHIAFSIDKADFDKEDQRLQQLGLEISYAYHQWVQWRSLFVHDPEGNLVEWVCYDPRLNN